MGRRRRMRHMCLVRHALRPIRPLSLIRRPIHMRSRHMTRARLKVRDVQEQPSTAPVPACPLCNKPMRQRIARQGANARKPFWGCTATPTAK